MAYFTLGVLGFITLTTVVTFCRLRYHDSKYIAALEAEIEGADEYISDLKKLNDCLREENNALYDMIEVMNTTINQMK